MAGATFSPAQPLRPPRNHAEWKEKTKGQFRIFGWDKDGIALCKATHTIIIAPVYVAEIADFLLGPMDQNSW